MNLYIVNTFRHTGTHMIKHILGSCKDVGFSSFKNLTSRLLLSTMSSKKAPVPLHEQTRQEKKTGKHRYKVYENIVVNMHHHLSPYSNPIEYDSLFNPDLQSDVKYFIFATYRHPLSVIGTSLRRLCRKWTSYCCQVRSGEEICNFCQTQIVNLAIERIHDEIEKYRNYINQTNDFKSYVFYQMKTDVFKFKGYEFRKSFFKEIFESTGLVPTEDTWDIIKVWGKEHSRLTKDISTDNQMIMYNVVENHIFDESTDTYRTLKDFCDEDIFSEWRAYITFSPETMKGLI